MQNFGQFQDLLVKTQQLMDLRGYAEKTQIKYLAQTHQFLIENPEFIGHPKVEPIQEFLHQAVKKDLS